MPQPQPQSKRPKPPVAKPSATQEIRRTPPSTVSPVAPEFDSDTDVEVRPISNSVVRTQTRVETASENEIDSHLRTLTRRTSIEELARTGRTHNLKTLSERDLKDWIKEALRKVISTSTTLGEAERERMLASTRTELNNIMIARQAEGQARAEDAALAGLTAERDALVVRANHLEVRLARALAHPVGDPQELIELRRQLGERDAQLAKSGLLREEAQRVARELITRLEREQERGSADRASLAALSRTGADADRRRIESEARAAAALAREAAAAAEQERLAGIQREADASRLQAEAARQVADAARQAAEQREIEWQRAHAGAEQERQRLAAALAQASAQHQAAELRSGAFEQAATAHRREAERLAQELAAGAAVLADHQRQLAELRAASEQAEQARQAAGAPALEQRDRGAETARIAIAHRIAAEQRVEQLEAARAVLAQERDQQARTLAELKARQQEQEARQQELQDRLNAAEAALQEASERSRVDHGAAAAQAEAAAAAASTELQTLRAALARARAVVTDGEGAPREDVPAALVERAPGSWLTLWREPAGRLRSARLENGGWTSSEVGSTALDAVGAGVPGATGAAGTGAPGPGSEPQLLARSAELIAAWQDQQGHARLARLDEDGRLREAPSDLGPVQGAPGLCREWRRWRRLPGHRRCCRPCAPARPGGHPRSTSRPA